MAPNTRTMSVFVKRVMNPTHGQFMEELKKKQRKMKPFLFRNRYGRKCKKMKLQRVHLKNANERVLAPAIQIERPIEVFMQTIQQQAQNLKRVADYRVENGIIVIDA